MRMRCAQRVFRSSATTSSASPVGLTRRNYTFGYDGGVADAQTALRLHAAAGGADSAPIFFSVDEDIDLNAWNSVAVEWFPGNQLGADRGTAPDLRTFPGVCLGDPRQRNRALDHCGAPVGMADEHVV